MRTKPTRMTWLVGMVEGPAPARCLLWPFPVTGGGTHPRPQMRAFGTNMTAAHAALVLRDGFDCDLEAMHSCHNRLCVNIRHLSWGTRAENQQDERGQPRRTNRLSEEEISEILRRMDAGEKRLRVARQFGISASTATAIAKRQGKIIRGYNRVFV